MTENKTVPGAEGAGPGSAASRTAVLDDLHVGDIRGAMGTIRQEDTGPRRTLRRRLTTLLAIVGPGLIVMVGDNDAGAFGTYTEAGQNYGTTLLWTLLMLVPVIFVNQEMVLRLGAVTGVGHARLILERFGKFWGAFSVIDLFVLNALTIVTEFVGVSLACSYLGLPKIPTVIVAAVLVVAAVSTGSFRRFERLSLVLVGFSLVIIPIVLMVHPPVGQIAHDFVVPAIPGGSGQLSDVMLLIIAIVGTTVAPWQLFFQQSYVIDKRITPRFIRYGRADLIIGIVIVVAGAAAMMIFCAGTFAGRPEFGNYTDAAGTAAGLGQYVSHTAGVLFAIGLLDASILGAAAVGLSTSYALSDVLSINHSLHRPVTKAKGFYVCYAGLMAVAAVLVLTPGVPLGALTSGVQTLAGVLLPSASVFLLLLCNDKAVLGPWVNGRGVNVFTGIVVWVLVLLSVILTASVLFPDIGSGVILAILGGGGGLGALLGVYLLLASRRARMKALVGKAAEVRAGDTHDEESAGSAPEADRDTWRMPPLSELARPVLSTQHKLGLMVLRGYLLVAFALVVVKIVQISIGS
ncbi:MULTISPECIES: NRAMP family divalent metal transporter [Amycolatopsis]|uniref:NRAMP family divalent metal transporter n=1 Tax=Amycolatopsis albidoflavus TaxID=102226 RepID=A0ABW5HTM6_9PSEU